MPAALPPGVTNLSYMFCGASTLNLPIDTWNTGSVTDMSFMFADAGSVQPANRQLEYRAGHDH